MEEQERLTKIRKHFQNIRECHNWCLAHFPDALGLEGKYTEADMVKLNEQILPAVEKEYEYLEVLGVNKTFSACLFVFGALFTQNLVNQFRA